MITEIKTNFTEAGKLALKIIDCCKGEKLVIALTALTRAETLLRSNAICVEPEKEEKEKPQKIKLQRFSGYAELTPNPECNP